MVGGCRFGLRISKGLGVSEREVSKKESEKLGIPHWKQIQLALGFFNELKFSSVIPGFEHFMWCHVWQELHFRFF